MSKQLMIGGQALVKLGSSRHPVDIYYLSHFPGEPDFIHIKEENLVYCNAAGNGEAGKFFAEIWELESKNIGELASPQALLELKAFAFAQHVLNGHWRKADEAEFDIKFLVRQFNLTGVKIVKKYIAQHEIDEIEKVIKSVRK